MTNRHTLYELCVQSVRHAVPLLRAIHGNAPRILGEDFAGTAALSRHWLETDAEARAIAVDSDADTLAHAGEHERLTTIVGDVLGCDAPADVIFVGNFSIGYLHTRAELVRYLRHAHGRLGSTSPERERGGSSSNVFVCDTYGGETSFAIGEVHRPHPIPEDKLAEFGVEPGTRVRYTWEQREADPLTGMVTNAIHFRLERAGVISEEFIDAFVYEWRLWSVPELRDAMLEAGFAETAVYAQLPDAVDSDGNPYIALVDPYELEDNFIVCVAGRV